MDKIEEAFLWAKRQYFISAHMQPLASFNTPVPIGYGQTNSQPSTVESMLEWLQVEQGNKILDVGSGSGWTTALLSYLTGSRGFVYAVEKIPELVDFGRLNCNKLNIKNVQFNKASASLGIPKKAPFDRILVSASANELPQELINQLKTDGKLVIPVNYDIFEIYKPIKGDLEINTHPGYIFVPLKM